ncbi:Tse2 family ADP-ribosyltransferase toxin [Dendronalium phyllosphericum]
MLCANTGNNWWKLEQGTEIPSSLKIVNDYGNHWSWEPSYTMRMEEYKAALCLIGGLCYKVS